jgi:hypothetical protein
MSNPVSNRRYSQNMGLRASSGKGWWILGVTFPCQTRFQIEDIPKI